MCLAERPDITETSRVAEDQEFQDLCQQYDVSLEEFSDNFWNEVESKGDSALNAFLSSIDYDNTGEDYASIDLTDIPQVTVYYPYSDNWLFELDQRVTLVAAENDIDRADGEEPVYVNSVLNSYMSVMVDDDYADNTPTHIIGINGTNPDPGTPPSSAFPPTGPIDLPNLPREVKQVYVGDVRCVHQYDRFISLSGNGGGSEIRFTRSDGFLVVVDGQVQANVYKTDSRTIRRGQIVNEVFVNFGHEWDIDWEPGNLQQHMAVYEEDNRNTSTLTGSLSTTIVDSGNTGVGNIGFTINFKSDDEIAYQSKHNLDVFFILNRTNLEGEMYLGWPVRNKDANISFTLNDRTYY